MSERSPRPHPEQHPKADFSRYTEALITLADRMKQEEQEENRRGKPISRREIPLGSQENLSRVKDNLREGLGKLMLHPHKAKVFRRAFSENTQATHIALMANKSVWQRNVDRQVNLGEPRSIVNSPGYKIDVGISIGYADKDKETGKVHKAIQTIWMSTDSSHLDGHPTLERVVIKRLSDKIDRKEPVPADEKQAKCFVEVAQELYDIYEAEQRKKRGNPYDWFD